MDIFLSYCRKDDKVADDIYDYFRENHNITLHRDKIDIKNWESIKAYMQSLNDMEYIILIISENYLKSSNCMYEGYSNNLGGSTLGVYFRGQL